MDENTTIDVLAANAIAQKPDSFIIRWVEGHRSWRTFYLHRYAKRSKRIYLYKPSAEKVALVSALVLQLGVDEARMKESPVSEAMRIASSKMPIALRIIAIQTTADWTRVYDEDWLDARVKFFGRMLDVQAVATLLEWVLMAGEFLPFANALGLILQVNVISPKAQKKANTKK